MKIAIIGAGFTGLAAADKLLSAGHSVDIFEKSDHAGGLASGFKKSGWNWQLEEHYHHLFTSDTAFIKLSEDLGIPVDFYTPKTSTYYRGDIYQLNDPLSLLKFNPLPFFERLRTGAAIAGLKVLKNYRPLENIQAEKFIRLTFGNKSWEVLWHPLFQGKFAEYSKDIAAVWFWSRIHKRSTSLGYPRGGFGTVVTALTEKIIKKGGNINFNRDTTTIIKSGKSWQLNFGKSKSDKFDRIICTLPSPIFSIMTPGLSEKYRQNLNSSKGIGAVNLVVQLSEQFFQDNTYWLNVNDTTFPFLALVEHTNMVDPKKYAGQHLLYIGNYLKPDHQYFRMTPKALLMLFTPYLQKISPNFNPKQVLGASKFTSNFAQPIVDKGYAKRIPQISTPLPGIFLANMGQVYPWDRGTTYAIELGHQAANYASV